MLGKYEFEQKLVTFGENSVRICHPKPHLAHKIAFIEAKATTQCKTRLTFGVSSETSGVLDGGEAVSEEVAALLDKVHYTYQILNTGTVTCLLYTSPSPRDATLSRMPSSA